MFRKSWILSIAFVLLGFLASFVGFRILERPGLQLHDWMQRLTAPANAPGVALVLVDQHTLTQMSQAESHSFPFPRQFFGLTAEIGKRAGATAVVFDILFTEPSRHGVDDDEAFAKILKESGLPVFMIAGSNGGTIRDPIQRLAGAVTALGAAHPIVDPDGVIRRMPEKLLGKEGHVPSLAAITFRRLTGRSPASSGVDGESSLLRFYSKTAIPFISFYDLVLAHREVAAGKPLPASLEKLKGRVLIVGYSAPGLFDMKPNPIDTSAPGILIPATALANLFDGKQIAIAPRELRYACTMILILLAMAFALRVQSPRNATLVVAGLATLGAAAASLGAWNSEMWLNPLPLAFGVVFGGGSQLVYNFQTQWRDRLLFAKSLENSMSPKMVELIRNGEVEVSRFGEERSITVLFCDLGGFTSLSEKLTPADVVEILNEYLDRSVHLIVDHEGYVDKFIGDSVMAFWGAPIAQENQAVLALRAGVEYKSVVDRLNQDLRAKYPGLRPLTIRIGIHSGPALVGNIGAQTRHNYTAIGDTVNLASRLEGIGKAYDTDLIVSEDVIEGLNAEGFYEVDHVKVLGREQPTRIYAYARQIHRARIPVYRKGLAAYYAGRWDEALGYFVSCFDSTGSVPGARAMISRCNDALDKGPPSQLKDGVWHHDSK